MKKIICIILSLLVLCLVIGCTPQTPGDGEAILPEGFEGELVTGLTKEEIASDSELAAWLDKCAESGRDDMFGCYAHKTAYIGDASSETTKYVVYIYRANIAEGADVKLETFEEKGNTVARVTYTSNGSEGGYDIIKLETEVEAGTKLIVEPVCDGDYPGCITTNRTVNEN